MMLLKPLRGHLLVAEPAIMGDVSFNRSIVLIAEHNQDGTIGFILNKPLCYTINDLISEITTKYKVYNGGPVEQDSLYFIHKVPHLIPNSIEISLGVYWGGDFKKVIELTRMEIIKETDIRFFLGYSGWESNQLESELKAKSWLVSKNVYEDTIIEKDDQSLWKEKMKEFGGEYSIWCNAPENPSHN